VAGVALSCQATARLPHVLADPLQIEVVLRNLIQNAMESAAGAGAHQGRVGVNIGLENEREIVVSVHDNGGGIRDADTERMFDSFATTKPAGMGMGLAISRAIVDAHGGHLWAVPGNSGLLCFTLPLDAASGEKS
jgi:signal transduction histidine kinase